MKTPLPCASQLVIPALPYLFVFAGAPECWHQVNRQRTMGHYNHLCLPDPAKAVDYFWPVSGCGVIVMVYGTISAPHEATLLALLCQYRATEVVIRHWPAETLLIRRPRP